jgi:hypothetical protein
MEMILDEELPRSRLAVGALVTIDVMGCQVAIADKIVEHKAGFPAGQDTSLPEAEVPTPGRWIRSDRKNTGWLRPRARRLADLSSCRVAPGNFTPRPSQNRT